MTDEHYENWLAKRREVAPPESLTDQIMNQVMEADLQRRSVWWLHLVHQIERSRAACWAACGGALAIGGLPFLFLARVAKLVTF